MSNTPRVARSLAELKVGQVVALRDKDVWRIQTVKELMPGPNDCVRFEPSYDGGFSVVNIAYYPLVVLSDPPEPVVIPRKAWDQFYDAIPPDMGEDELEKVYGDLGVAVCALVRAVKP